jgi:tetratricopeptide (TPR) repeat protein
VQNHKFIIAYDDYQYVTKNVHVQKGLSPESISWAFTTTDAGFWHPLTWLSLMLDYQLYGLNAGGYHWTNLLLHIISTLLLFSVLYRMTGSIWRSGFVAALFALHPLHVESVALVAQRKDVLSTVFWMLTMYAYVSYVDRPGVWRYLVIFIAFILGLMAKPMLVTLPFVLVLLDYWPLNRFRFELKNNETDLRRKIAFIAVRPRNTISLLILEKIPFITLTIIISAITFFTEQKFSAIVSLKKLSLYARIENALVSYVEYISKMIFPVNLAVFYPHPIALPLWQVSLCLLLLICISVIVLYYIKKYPYLIVGWFWYLGTLVPVIGLIQVGSHAMADRYTYIPLIGLFIIVAWGFADLAKKWRYGRSLFSSSAILILILMMILTWGQLRYWKNGLTLFNHAIEVTEDNYFAYNNLATIFMEKGDYRQAYQYASKAIQIHPQLAAGHFNMGHILARLGDTEKAIYHLQEALKLQPDSLDAMKKLGDVFIQHGFIEAAISQYTKVLNITPNDPDIHNNLGVALAMRGRYGAALVHFRRALDLKPDYIDAKKNMELLLRKKKK